MKHIYKALANFQQEVPVIHKGTSGYGYSYADLPAIFEKINPLLVALNLSDYVLFFVDEINAAIGEEIITIDLMQKEGVFICEEYIYEQLKPILKGTSLETWVRINKNALLEHIQTLKEKETKTKLCQSQIF